MVVGVQNILCYHSWSFFYIIYTFLDPSLNHVIIHVYLKLYYNEPCYKEVKVIPGEALAAGQSVSKLNTNAKNFYFTKIEK